MLNQATYALLLAAAVAIPGSRPVGAQAGQAAPAACQDEDSMAQDATKGITDFVAEVKKESLPDFEAKFHQRAGVSKLNFALELTSQAEACFEKASQDSSASKDQQDAYKAKREQYNRETKAMTQARASLKATEDSKQAKAVIEKLNLK